MSSLDVQFIPTYQVFVRLFFISISICLNHAKIIISFAVFISDQFSSLCLRKLIELPHLFLSSSWDRVDPAIIAKTSWAIEWLFYRTILLAYLSFLPLAYYSVRIGFRFLFFFALNLLMKYLQWGEKPTRDQIHFCVELHVRGHL